MRLTVRHVKRTKAGTWEYRRKVPKHLVAKIGKREFKQVLGKSEAEALKKYQTFHAAIEASIMNSDVERVVEPNAGWTFERTALEDFRTALANLRCWG